VVSTVYPAADPSATPLKIQNTYDDYGFLTTISDGNGSPLWQCTAMNLYHQVTGSKLGGAIGFQGSTTTTTYAASAFDVQFESNYMGEVITDILSMEGQSIVHNNQHKENTVFTNRYYADALRQGVYWVRISTSQGQISRKLVILR